MSEQHTKGPWEWCGNHLEADRVTVLEVCDLPEGAYPELQSGELVIENPADRAIIEAAPDLLEALRLFTDFHDADHETGDAEHLQAMYDEAIDTARAAITKATQAEERKEA